MSSTRSKNTPGNYQSEQKSFIQSLNYSVDKNNSYGAPTTTHFAGDGLLAGRVAPENLYFNACDIESQLRGIGTSNLVEQHREVVPMPRNLDSLSIIDRLPILVPEPLVVEKNQRPYLN
jgi:hypothetical protein